MGLFDSLKKYLLPVLGVATIFFPGAAAGFLGIKGGLLAKGLGFLSKLKPLEKAALAFNLFGKRKKTAPGTGLYSTGNFANAASPDEPLPVIYGTLRVPGRVVFQKPAAGGPTLGATSLFAVSEGEVDSIGGVEIGNQPYAGLLAQGPVSGLVPFAGGAVQAPPAICSDYRGGLPHVAGFALNQFDSSFVPDPTVTARVRGVKIAAWNGATFDPPAWTDNPAWVVLDLLTHPRRGAGIDPATLDLDSFLDFANFCAAPVAGEWRPTLLNVAPAGTATGGSNPADANDDLVLSHPAHAWTVAIADDTVPPIAVAVLGTLDLGSAQRISHVALWLWSADARVYRAVKIETSTDNLNWTPLVDTTAALGAYRDRQVFLAPAGTLARYVRVSGSGNNLSGHFMVNELQVFTAEAAPRHAVNLALDSTKSAREWAELILAQCDAGFVYREGLQALTWGQSQASGFTFDENNIVENSVHWQDLPADQRPNQIAIRFFDPVALEVAEVSFDDTVDQEARGVRRQELELFQITSAAEAARVARRVLNLARHQRRAYEWAADFTTLGVLPGDVVTLAHPVAGSASRKVRIVEVSETKDGATRFSAIDHVDAIYQDQAAGPPLVVARRQAAATTTAAVGHPQGLALAVTQTALPDGTVIPRLNVTWTRPDDPAYVATEVEMSEDGGTTYASLGTSGGAAFLTPPLTPVLKWIRLIGLGANGARGSAETAPTASATIPATGGATAPAAVAGVAGAFEAGELAVTWTPSAEPDLAHYEVRYSLAAAQPWASKTPLVKQLKATAWKVPAPGGSDGPFYIQVRATNRSGQESPDHAEVLATANTLLKITNSTLERCTALVNDGALATPGLGFFQDPDTGLWRPAANAAELTAGGVAIMRWDQNLITFNKRLSGAFTQATASPGLTLNVTATSGGPHQCAQFVLNSNGASFVNSFDMVTNLNAGSVTSARAALLRMFVSGSSVSEAIGLLINDTSVSSGSLATNTGLRIDGRATGTTRTGLYVGSAAGGTVNNPILQDGGQGVNVLTSPTRLGGNAAANELSKFEKGTFTPAIRGRTTAGTPTYAASGQVGTYTIVGTLVTATGRAEWTALAGAVGPLVLNLAGLPASRNATNYRGGVNGAGPVAIALPAGSFPRSFVGPNTTEVDLGSVDLATGAYTALDAAAVTAGTIEFTITYHTGA